MQACALVITENSSLVYQQTLQNKTNYSIDLAEGEHQLY